jgi:hypothetical protein
MRIGAAGRDEALRDARRSWTPRPWPRFSPGEPAAGEVAALLRDPGDPAVISAVNVAETLDVLVRIGIRTPEEVEERLDWLTAAGLVMVPLPDSHGARPR